MFVEKPFRKLDSDKNIAARYAGGDVLSFCRDHDGGILRLG